MRVLKLLLFILLLQLSLSVQGKGEYENKFNWSETEPLPSTENISEQLGLLSPFVGISNGAVIVAGGCNFFDKYITEDSQERYYSDIYVLPKDSQKWVVGFNMPYAVARGAHVTTPKGLLCIGGDDSVSESDRVALLKWNARLSTIEIEEYPSLPFKLTQCGASIVGDIVYLMGGESEGRLSNYFMTLDLSKRGSDNFKWEVQPNFPGEPRLQPLVVSQSAAETINVYVFGGFSFEKESQTPYIATSGLLYNPATKQWKETSVVAPNGATPHSLHGSSSAAMGKNHIVFIGGVDMDTFESLLTQERKAELAQSDEVVVDCRNWRSDYLSRDQEWYNYNSDVLVYNTITNNWSVGDQFPYPAPVGAKLVPYNSGWLVINGEVKPGATSNKIYFASIDIDPVFGFANWTVLALYMLGMLYMGYYFMKKSDNSTDDFFKGGGRIPWWAAGISIFATMLSAITFMAVPAKAYATDWRYFPMVITILVMAFPVVKYYLPFFRRLNVTTAYEYLETRFNYGVRLLASSLFIIFMLARMALTLFLPSLALTTVTGIDIYLCIILMGVVTLIYCTMGGAEAVVWSDVVQGIILMGGAVFVVVFLIFNIPGGLSTLVEITIAEDKMQMFDFSFIFTSATFWVILLGGLANNLISYSSDQTVIQRYITTTSEKAAGKSIILNGFLSIGVSILFYFIGTGLYAFYKTQPESLNYMMQNTDSIFPHFIMAEIPMGFAGLIIAAIFAATMSTVSSNVNSLSTAFTVDLYRHFAQKSSDAKELNVARISGVIMGGIGIGVAILMASWNILSLLDFFNYLLGLLSSGVAALFLIGMFMPRVGAKSAMGGFLLGNIALITISIYSSVSFLLYGFIGLVLTVVFSLLLSLFFKNSKNITGYTWSTLKKQED